MIIYILYKTVRTETGEYYIGIHGIDTDRYPRFNDPYLGSGNRIKASVKKYGKKAFRRTILSITESRKEAEALEAAMVTVEIIADPLCLNLVPGGRGGRGGSKPPRTVEHCKAMSDCQKGVPKPAVSAALKGVPHSAERRQKQSDAHKGILRSVATCQAISAALKGVPHSAERRQKQSDAHKGVPKGPPSDSTRQKIRDALKEYWRQRELNKQKK